MKKHSKFLTCLIALSASLLTLITQDTVAYYSVKDIATNAITSGDVDICIIEKMGDAQFPKDGVYVKAGSIVSKKVSVSNIGGHPCWLRVKLTNGIDDTNLSADVFELNINTADWQKGDDGYYYYLHVLEPGQETPKLFTQVKIAGSVDGTYNGKTATLTVNAYAVQSENNSAESPLLVSGWPEEG